MFMSGGSFGWRFVNLISCLALIFVVVRTGQTSIETSKWSEILTTTDRNQNEELITLKQEIKKLKKKDFLYQQDRGGYLQSTNTNTNTGDKQQAATITTSIYTEADVEDYNSPPTPLVKDKSKYRGWVMMHTLKAGGNSVEKMLNSVGYNQSNSHSLYQRGRNGGYVYFEDTAIDKVWYDQYMSHWEDGNDAYFSALPRDEFFKIGMVREPCDYMVSMWAFSGKGNHGLLTGRCAGMESRDNFTQFLHETIMPYQFGWLSYRVSLQLGAAGKEKIEAVTCPSQASAATISRIETQTANFNATEAADCWVRTEYILADLRRCLQLYVRKRGGETSMTINNITHLEKAPQANKGMHKSCSEYYSEQEASAVWEREGKFAEQFGYSGCCKGLGVVQD